MLYAGSIFPHNESVFSGRMSMQNLYPLLLKPAYKDYLWGGERIIRHFNRDMPPGVYAESWEVSDRPEGPSVIANGPLAGQPLADILAAHGMAVMGSERDRFPLLIKLIDASKTLSVQVHPNDDTARRYGGEAKTEMWYILAADDEACVYAGLKDGVTPEQLRAALENNDVEPLLVRQPVRAGDAVFMPGGRVHAIGAGCLILEVQQNSNTTYRMYDWGRQGPDGKPRELHIEQSLQVIQWNDPTPALLKPRCLSHMENNELWEVLSCPYFRLERLVLHSLWNAGNDGHTFHVLFVARGGGKITWGSEGCAELQAGQSVLIPACMSAYELAPESGGMEILRATSPLR
jgi:mannose-6-phosphate isomerase